ncbi:MAG: hypothetical protein A4E28_00778 [Methanocella sp. PtaU1.Bin125]|nr:MAG: hypothetical protein A4E28_00778 [Methanocella sp. PtaU1.Bin125]
MKIAWKLLVTVVFAILIIAGAVAIYGLDPMGSGSNEADSEDVVIKGSVNVTTEPDRVELLYFHRTERCVSCNNAEQYTRDTLDKYYAEEMRSGQLSLQSIDYQQDRETADKYNVKVQGLKVVSTHNGQTNIKDIPEIWTYVGDKDAFMGFLKSVIDKELRK